MTKLSSLHHDLFTALCAKLSSKERRVFQCAWVEPITCSNRLGLAKQLAISERLVDLAQYFNTNNRDAFAFSLVRLWGVILWPAHRWQGEAAGIPNEWVQDEAAWASVGEILARKSSQNMTYGKSGDKERTSHSGWVAKKRNHGQVTEDEDSNIPGVDELSKKQKPS